MSNNGTFRDSKGRYMTKPSKPELLRETSTDQRPGQGHQGIWYGIPGQQGGMLEPGVVGFSTGMLFAPGGSFLNPLGFAGWGNPYFGNELTYRLMLQHPVIRLVRSITVGIIAANTWEYEIVEGREKFITEKQVKETGQILDGLRPRLMADFFARGRDYGWASGELIWKYADGQYELVRVKPLLNEVTKIIRDGNGNPIAIRNEVSQNGEPFVDLPMPYKAWKFTYDSEAGYVYGRSWLENFRSTAWIDWMDAMQQISKIGSKISGVITIIRSPAGTFPGPPDPTTGKPTTVSYRQNAIDTIEALANGAAGAWFPSLGLLPDAKGNIDAMKVLVELAGKSLTDVSVEDFSGNSQAIGPLLDRVRHAEENMFAGGLRSPRVGMETKHGQKADAEEHTDTGTLNAEVDDREFALECQPLADALNAVRYGERTIGAMRIKPPSLVDRKAQVMKAVMLSLNNDPSIAHESCGTLDMDKIYKALGLPLKGTFNADDVKKAVQQASQKKLDRQQPNPQGGRPDNNS